jgi:hypothetical protein
MNTAVGNVVNIEETKVFPGQDHLLAHCDGTTCLYVSTSNAPDCGTLASTDDRAGGVMASRPDRAAGYVVADDE